MTASDSLPIQFWDIDDETFNEKTVCGIIKQDCFCQPFECDDDITLQFESDIPISVEILDSDSTILESIDLSEVTTGVYQTSFVPSELGSPEICDGQYQFKIRKTNFIANGTFSHLDPWYNANPGGLPDSTKWSALSNKAQSIFNEFTGSQYLALAFSFRSGQSYTISFDFTKSSGTNALSVNLSNSSNFSSFTTAFNINPIVDGHYSATFTPSSNYSYIAIVASVASGSGTRTVTIDNVVSSTDYLLKSDCLDIRPTQDCTKLIEYSNSSDFDGLSYGINSPDPTFYLRVPAVFFEEENPQEQEDLELSNGQIVTIRQSIQEKRLLELGYMPNYMHRKVQKILMHETVTIDSHNWKRRDPYEPSPVKKYNLKRASVLLTKYDSVEKNTI